ncbi:MAG: hypothetical protein LKI83_04045 [Actinomyces sp.]|jgi:hypothetical protein|nr:hypothetical protein [Actinomyces sp.]
MDLILIAAGLGVAGVDILGVVLAVAALRAGATRRSLALFAGTVFVGTVLVGTVSSLCLGTLVTDAAGLLGGVSNRIWVIVEAIAVGLLWFWAARRWRRRSTVAPGRPENGPRAERLAGRSLLGAGILFSLSALTDPSYLALIALSGHNGSIPTVVGAQVLWILVSQVPLFVFTGAFLAGGEQRLTAWFDRIQSRYSDRLSGLLTAVIALAGLVLAADLADFLLTGEWLLD